MKLKMHPEQELPQGQARSEIQNTPLVKNDPNLYGPIYQNVSMFKRYYFVNFPLKNNFQNYVSSRSEIAIHQVT